MENLYRFTRDFGRMGDLEGLFISTEQEVKSAIGKKVYFGEVLGKHSEVYCVLEDKDIAEVPVLKSTVEDMEKHIGVSISGYNPLDYISHECSVCGDSMTVQDCDWYRNGVGEDICEYCANGIDKSELTKL